MRGRSRSLRTWILASTWTHGVSWSWVTWDVEHGSQIEAAYLTTCLLPVCIVGPNGVGKSTLLLLLTGKLTPVSFEAQRERKDPAFTR